MITPAVPPLYPPPDQGDLFIAEIRAEGQRWYDGMIGFHISELPTELLGPIPNYGPDAPFGYCYATWEHRVTCTQKWTEWHWVREHAVAFGEPTPGDFVCLPVTQEKKCKRSNAQVETTNCKRTAP
jgi:hypothetical protein